MPKKLDSSIYGADPTTYAEGIASSALSPKSDAPEDVWGGVTDSRAKSDDNRGESLGDVKVISDKAGDTPRPKGN